MKMLNIAINHVFVTVSITRKVFEHLALGLVFKHLPHDIGNV